MKPVLLCFLLSTAAPRALGQFCAQHVVVPGYSRLARMARLQGSVRVEIKVGADGKVVSATATGNDRLLERASEENIRQWRFCPASSAQESVRTQTVTYVYRLEGREEYYDPPPRVVLDLPEKVEITSHPPEPQP